VSRVESGVGFYLLVSGVGVIAAVFATTLYVLYLRIWSVAFNLINDYALVFLLAFLALGMSYIVVRVFAQTKTTGSGTHLVLETYHLRNGDVDFRDGVVKPLAAMLTLGFGGSAGPEGPSLLVGGGIASRLSKHFHVRADLRRRIFIAGAAAGLAATFRTPLTGILFALEIPYKNDLDRETFIEASIASIPSYLISAIILGSERIFSFGEVKQITLYDIALSLVLGLVCSLYAVFFVKTFSFFEDFGIRLRKKIGNFGLILLGAIFLGVSGYLSIYSIGIGLHFIDAIIKGTGLTVTLLLAIVLLKTLATAITLNFGGSGGLFFPTTIIGAGIGYLFSIIVGADSAALFMAVGMASLLSGTHKVLLTPTAFVVETLGGVYAIPALLASSVSYLISGNHSFFPIQPRTRLKSEELALERFFIKGKKMFSKKMEEIRAKEFMTENPVSVHFGTTFNDALVTFEKTRVRVLPVVDENMRVHGIVTLEDLGSLDYRHRGKALSEALMHKPLTISKETSLKKVAEMMMETGEDHVFVVDKDEKLIGVISGIDIVRKITEILRT